MLLAPSLVGLAAFGSAFAVIIVTGTNRTRADFLLGHLGFAAVPVAILAEAGRTLVLRRAGRSLLRLVLSGLVRLAALVVLALAWLAAHLA